MSVVAIVLSIGPVFVLYGWLVGLDVHIRGGLLGLLVDVLAATLGWYVVVRMRSPRRRLQSVPSEQ